MDVMQMGTAAAAAVGQEADGGERMGLIQNLPKREREREEEEGRNHSRKPAADRV